MSTAPLQPPAPAGAGPVFRSGLGAPVGVGASGDGSAPFPAGPADRARGAVRVGNVDRDGLCHQQSVLSMLVAASFLGLAGAGQTLVVLVGGIDFSVPAFISAASVVISQLTGTDHWSFVLALFVCAALAASPRRGQRLHRPPLPRCSRSW